MEAIGIGFIFTVLGAGILSFFSPCVLPVLPVYISHLVAGRPLGEVSLGKRLLQSLAFVAGLSVVFFLLGLGAGALGGIINNSFFYIACGVIVFLFGLFYAGVLKIPFLDRQKKLSMPKGIGKGTLVGAFVLGFVFSFAWTPCVGPILASVLAMSANQGDALTGGLLLIVYSLGLGIPFLILTAGSEILIDKVKGLNKYLPKIQIVGGVLLAVLGLYMIFSQVASLESNQPQNPAIEQTQSGQMPSAEGDAVAFALQDMEGDTVNIADYQGKPVYLKFWATWCPVCLSGMPNYQMVANEYNEAGDVAVISIVAPGVGSELDADDFTDWAKGQGLDFPILFDTSASVNKQFGVKAYPTSVFIDKDGVVSETRIGEVEPDEVRSILDSLKKS